VNHHFLTAGGRQDTTVVLFGPGWDYVQGTGDIEPMVRALLLARPYWEN
jgi:hypothetical protein